MPVPATIEICRSKRLRGFTLMEIVLVLALLVIIAAFALPKLTGSISRRHLQTAAQRLKADWSRARSTAIRTGVTQLFLYRTDGRSYVVVSEGLDAESLAVLDRAQQELLRHDPEVELPSHAAMGIDAATLPYQIRRLPIEVLFYFDPYAADSGATDSSQAGGTMGDSGGTMGGLLEGGSLAVIAFQPDGTTSSASLILRNKKQEMIYLLLRGLTGTVTIGEVQSGESL